MLGRTLLVVFVFVDSNDPERPWAVCSKGHEQYVRKAMSSLFERPWVVCSTSSLSSSLSPGARHRRRQGTVAEGKTQSEARHGHWRQGTVGGKARSLGARHGLGQGIRRRKFSQPRFNLKAYLNGVFSEESLPTSRAPVTLQITEKNARERKAQLMYTMMQHKSVCLLEGSLLNH